MPTAGIDLKSLLDQGRRLGLDTLDASRNLVLEIKASHYWTTYTLEILSQLRNIGGSIEKLLTACEPHWGEGKRIFEREEAMKLWKTAFGLWRALQKVRNKYTDHISLRRRQRIMGQEIEEVEEYDPEVLEEELRQLKEQHAAATELFERLEAPVAQVPANLQPEPKTQQPGVDGQIPGGVVQAVAGKPVAKAEAEKPVQAQEPAQPPVPPASGESSKIEGDELTPA